MGFRGLPILWFVGSKENRTASKQLRQLRSTSPLADHPPQPFKRNNIFLEFANAFVGLKPPPIPYLQCQGHRKLKYRPFVASFRRSRISRNRPPSWLSPLLLNNHYFHGCIHRWPATINHHGCLRCGPEATYHHDCLHCRPTATTTIAISNVGKQPPTTVTASLAGQQPSNSMVVSIVGQQPPTTTAVSMPGQE